MTQTQELRAYLKALYKIGVRFEMRLAEEHLEPERIQYRGWKHMLKVKFLVPGKGVLYGGCYWGRRWRRAGNGRMEICGKTPRVWAGTKSYEGPANISLLEFTEDGPAGGTLQDWMLGLGGEYE